VAKSKEDLKRDTRITSMGSGVYNTISLFNHSCVANAGSFMVEGNRYVLYSARFISKGEEVTIQHIPSLLTLDASKRRNLLLQAYW
jgi:hypothetical protein